MLSTVMDYFAVYLYFLYRFLLSRSVTEGKEKGGEEKRWEGKKREKEGNRSQGKKKEPVRNEIIFIN